MNNPPTYDFITLLIFLSALMFGNDVAAVVGPYVAIIAAAAIGASFALSRREKDARPRALLFFVRIVCLALLITVGLAQLAQAYAPTLNERLLLIPIALLVGYIGDEWTTLFDAVFQKLLGFVSFFHKEKP